MTLFKHCRRRLIIAAVTLAVAIAGWVGQHSSAASPAHADPQLSLDAAEALRIRYAALRMQLEQSPFQRPLYLESAAGPTASQGDVYALVDRPVASVIGSLTNPGNWCEVLILHPNVKYCRTDTQSENAVLRVAMATKYDQTLDNAYRVDFSCSVTSSGADYMEAALDAAHGPFGTRDYRIALQAVAIEGGRTLLHLQYSFGYGFQARLAMRLYLATSGHDKVGFTMVDRGDDRPPRPVRGIRGAVERNVMRYYLGVDAHLASLAAPESDRFEQSLELWFNATEVYARQLHEVDRDTYLAIKRQEYRRQQRPDDEILR